MAAADVAAPAAQRSAWSRRVRIILSLAVLGGAVAYLLSQSFGDAMVYSKYVDELLADRDRYLGRNVRVEGVVETGSFESRPGTLDYRFRLVKGGKSLQIAYHGSEIPDTFAEGRGAVVQGRLRPHGDFHAERIMAKCPSKYEMMENQRAGLAAPHLLAAPPAPTASSAGP